MVREHHMEWFADMIQSYADLPKVILGKSYKPETNLTAGSPSVRLYNGLADRNASESMWDPFVDGANGVAMTKPAVFFVGTRHHMFADFEYPSGSIVIDPFGYVQDMDGIRVVRVGRQ